MEYYWTLFNNSNSTSCTNRAAAAAAAAAHNVGNSNNNNNNTWESWELGGGNINAGGSGVSRVDWSYPFHNSSNYAPSFTDGSVGGGGKDQPVYYRPDPHLTCLKLGKRHYFENVTAPPMADGHMAAVGGSVSKKGKPYLAGTTEIDATSAAVVVVPRCQVEGCDIVLVNAKEYHRRHKVCEMHAKAPKVVVLGMEQRFCQQCSRFHAVAEFDETKRSCRRRLAGHNERRRKSSQEQHSLAKKVPYQDMKTMIGTASTHPQYVLNSRDCALSLLSSPNYSFPYNNTPNALPPPSSTADLPSRCSAALRELIAENRASILAFRQLMNPNNYQIEDDYNNNNNTGSDPQENGGHVTLDLMQAPTSAFGVFSVHDHKSSSKTAGGNEEDCSELWKVPNLGNY